MIDTIWSVPVKPLRFAGTNIAQGPAFNHGFQNLDDCTRSQATPYTTIKSVSITGDNRVIIQLTAPYNNSCANPTLQNAYDGPALASYKTTPTVKAPGYGGSPNASCVITTAFDTVGSQGQAQYLATTDGTESLASIVRLTYTGIYPLSNVGILNGVSVTGCGLYNAVIDRFELKSANDSFAMSGAWSDLADSDTTFSRSGQSLEDFAVVFSLPIAPNN